MEGERLHLTACQMSYLLLCHSHCSIKDGEVRVYTGDRIVNELVSFIKEEKWRDDDPISYWKSPTAPQ